MKIFYKFILIPFNSKLTKMTSYASFGSTSYDDIHSRSSNKCKKKQGINKIFQECIEYTNDEFWQDMLYEASRGIFPKGFLYRESHLNFRDKPSSTPLRVFIPEDNPREAIGLFINFLKENRGIYSDNDTECMERDIMFDNNDSNNNNNIVLKLEDIVNRKTVLEYVELCKRTYGMTDRQSKSYYQAVILGMKLNILTKEMFSIVNNGRGYEITEIRGIQYDNNTGLFMIDQQLLHASLATTRKKMKCIARYDQESSRKGPKITVKKQTDNWTSYNTYLNKFTPANVSDIIDVEFCNSLTIH